MARHRLIACEVFFREFCQALTSTPNVVNVEFASQGLHGRRSFSMAGELQRRIDACDDGTYHAILLGYGLCNNGIVGLHARHTPLVVPRAHDCITLFLGSRRRYDEMFRADPGSYYLTSGWIERTGHSMETLPSRAGGVSARGARHAEYVERFGEENAEYLMEVMHSWKDRYARMVFINLGVGNVDADRAHAANEAAEHDLEFAEVAGDLQLFRGLLNGPPWDEDTYLVVPPGMEIHPSYDEQVVAARAPVSAGAGP